MKKKIKNSLYHTPERHHVFHQNITMQVSEIEIIKQRRIGSLYALFLKPFFVVIRTITRVGAFTGVFGQK